MTSLQTLISRHREPTTVGFSPTLLVDAELAAPLPRLRRDRAAEPAYGAADVLVTLHGEPLGTVVVELSADPLEPDELAAFIRERLGPQIDAHLANDSMTLEALPAFGCPGPDAPRPRTSPRPRTPRTPRTSRTLRPNRRASWPCAAPPRTARSAS